MYLFWPYYWKGQIGVCFGLFLLIHSPKLKSEHTAPTFQPLASGLTPHMPMFGHHEIFTFWWEGKILKWKSTQLTVKNFVKKKLYSISYIRKATKSGSAPIFWRFHLVLPLPTPPLTYPNAFGHKVVELVGGGSVINGAYPVYFFDKTELFPRPDTLCYTVELAHCNVPYFYIYHFLPPPARWCALCSSGPCPSGRKLQALQCIAESHTFWEVGRKIPFYL